MALVRDNRGKVPNFLIWDGHLIHQPTGKKVELKSKSHADIRAAMKQLKGLI